MHFLELGQVLSENLNLQAWSSKNHSKKWGTLKQVQLEDFRIPLLASFLCENESPKLCWLKGQCKKLCPRAIPAPISVA